MNKDKPQHHYSLTDLQIDELKEWKETVRDLYDECHAHPEDTDSRTVIRRIQENHPEFFGLGKEEPEESEEDEINPEDCTLSDLLEQRAAEYGLEGSKAQQLLTLFKWGFNCSRIEDSLDGDHVSTIDPPDLEYGLWIEPRLAKKIRDLLSKEIQNARNIDEGIFF